MLLSERDGRASPSKRGEEANWGHGIQQVVPEQPSTSTSIYFEPHDTGAVSFVGTLTPIKYNRIQQLQ
jgi:hypothetical protein